MARYAEGDVVIYRDIECEIWLFDDDKSHVFLKIPDDGWRWVRVSELA